MVDATQLVGRCFVWEPSSPHAMAQVVVVSVRLNADQDWYVEFADLVTGKLAWNELDRFREATMLSGEQIAELIREGEKSA